MNRIFQPFLVRHHGPHLPFETRDQRTGWSFHASTVQYSQITMISTLFSHLEAFVQHEALSVFFRSKTTLRSNVMIEEKNHVMRWNITYTTLRMMAC